MADSFLPITDASPQVVAPARCVIVVSADLPAGRAANAAAVIALTMGRSRPDLVGDDLVDRSGFAHPGLIPIGTSVLAAPADQLGDIRAKALAKDIEVVDFPAQGQQTNDYAEFMAAMRECPADELTYVGVGLVGCRKAIGKIVGRYGLFT